MSLLYRIWPLFGVLFLMACLKDGVLPQPKATEGPLELRFDWVHGMQPLDLATTYQDGVGRAVRFAAIKFLLCDLHAYDDDSTLVAGFPGSTLLVDARYPGRTWAMGNMADGHIHAIHFTAGHDRPTGTGSVQDDPEMLGPHGHLRAQLLITGHVDSNGDGIVDPLVDQPFELRPGGPLLVRQRHLHLHADMFDGRTVTLGLMLDIRMLMIGVDLLNTPHVAGEGEDAARLMNNLAAGIMVRY